MPHQSSKIIYTHTDEAPALATKSLLPIIRAFTEAAGIVSPFPNDNVLAAMLNCPPLETKSKLVTALADSGIRMRAVRAPRSRIGLWSSIVSVPL